MSTLTKTERYVIALLSIALIAGTGVRAYRRSQAHADVHVVPCAASGGGDRALEQSFREQRININTASREELMCLKGVGEKLAQRIIDHRTSHGPFTSPEGLKDVPGIGEKIFDDNRERMTVEE